MANLDFSDGTYEGEINKNGEKHGKGIYRWSDGSTYEGGYQNDLRHGNGRFLWGNGESYEGKYLNDKRTGKGLYSWPDGSVYDGDFVAGKRHGDGRFRSVNGIIYKGEWFDDLQHGSGSLLYPDGRMMKGIWRLGAIVSKPAVLPTASPKPALPNISSEDIVSPPLELITSPAPKHSHQSDLEPRNINPLGPPKVAEDVSPTTIESVPESSNTIPSNHDGIELHTLPHELSEALDPKDLTVDGDDIGETQQDVPIIENNSLENTVNEPDWEGTVLELEEMFVTVLNDGIDTIIKRQSGSPFTGRMRIINEKGYIKGEVYLLKGQLHGEEIIFNKTGEISERIFWDNGRQIDQ